MVGRSIVSMTGAGVAIKFIAKRAGLAVNPRNEQFYDSLILELLVIHLIFGLEILKRQRQSEDIIYIFKYNSSPGISGKSGSIVQ